MLKQQVIPVITIDGPSGTGKGTITHRLAQHLGWHYLDSGAIYRALAWRAQDNHVAIDNVDAIVSLAKQLDLAFEIDSQLHCRTYLHGKEVTQQIRSEACGQTASKIAALPAVRDALLARQRAFAEMPGLVTDGRDMGTVVFPDAEIKFFLYASIEERARRRLLQLKNSHNDASLAQVVNQLVERDARDSERSCAPLKPAHDAIQIDTTALSIDEVFSQVLQHVGEVREGHM